MCQTFGISKQDYKKVKKLASGGIHVISRPGRYVTGTCEVVTGGGTKPIACHVKEGPGENDLTITRS